MSEADPNIQHIKNGMNKTLVATFLICLTKIYYHTVTQQFTPTIIWTLILTTVTLTIIVLTPLPELLQPLPPLIQLQCHTCPHRKETNPFAKCVLYGGLRVTLFSGGLINRCRGR